jgi:hypothetical protein
MVWAGRLEKLFEVTDRLLCLALEIMFGGSNVFHDGVICLLAIIIVIVASSDCDPLGHRFGPFLLALALLLAPLLAAFGGAPQLSPGTIFPSLWMKTASTTYSPKACWVAMSRSSFVVFN